MFLIKVSIFELNIQFVQTPMKDGETLNKSLDKLATNEMRLMNGWLAAINVYVKRAFLFRYAAIVQEL